MSKQRDGLLLLALASLAAFTTVVVAQHALSPELDPADHAVSEYANADAGALMTAGFLAWSLALATTSVLVLRRGIATAGDGGRQLVAACLALAALGAAVTAFFPTQAVAAVVPEGTPRTEAGLLHDFGSGAATLALLVAAVVSVRLVTDRPVFRLTVVSLLVAAVALDVVLLAVGDPIPGVRQRVLLLAGCVWHVALLKILAQRVARDRAALAG